MSRILCCFAVFAIGAGGVPRASAAEWKTITPREAGLDGSALDAWKNALANSGTSGLLVVRRGAIAYEWYSPESGAAKPHGTASMAKALVGGMCLLVALSDGRIAAGDLASKYIPGWSGDPRKSKITIRHLATHTSGIEDAEQDALPHDKLPGWKGAFWKRSPDPFSLALRQAPVIFEPGSRYAYSNPGMAALSYAVTASLKGGDVRSLLKERIFEPLGIPESSWSIGYGRGYELDGLTLYANWGGASFTARAAARIGQLMMRQGEWEGRELVRRSAVQEVVAYAGMPKPPREVDRYAPASGLAWYTNSDGVWPDIPRDAIAGAGAGHQVIVVIPSLQMVVVRNGQVLTAGAPFWTPVYEKLLHPLMSAVTERAPYPRSPAIRKLVFLPDIRRAAIDSDNWPITWADDDAQYTSYGDGWGFEPRTRNKLGMGFARILGGPESFRGVNLPSNGERAGDGPKSPKASGILMVDGALYLWVRNVGNSQLLWSKDHGRSWESGFKLETSFGSPTFLNFGRDYRGARDDFVYTYSQDGPSAYESDNQLVLARVPKRQIRERAAWEFFVKVDEKGQPLWNSDIRQRGPVFTYTGNCRRSDVVYNPGIHRYLLALAYDASGDWGIFDAPEPWGPWTTAFHNDASKSGAGENRWGIAGTHGYRLPAKWISRDGLAMTLVFSGVRLQETTYDAFCTRTMRIEVAP